MLFRILELLSGSCRLEDWCVSCVGLSFLKVPRLFICGAFLSPFPPVRKHAPFLRSFHVFFLFPPLISTFPVVHCGVRDGLFGLGRPPKVVFSYRLLIGKSSLSSLFACRVGNVVCFVSLSSGSAMKNFERSEPDRLGCVFSAGLLMESEPSWLYDWYFGAACFSFCVLAGFLRIGWK